jgi:hypothetical protein
MVENKYYFSPDTWHREEAQVLCRQFEYKDGLISSVQQSDLLANVTFGYRCDRPAPDKTTANLPDCSALARDWPATNETATAFCCDNASGKYIF